MAITIAIFDFDGTVVDSQEVGFESCCAVFTAFDIPPPSREVWWANCNTSFVDFYYHRGIPATITRQAINEVYHRNFIARMHRVRLRQGLIKTMLFCGRKGIPADIVSGSPVPLEGCRMLGISNLFRHIYTECRDKREWLLHAAAHSKAPTKDCCYVDDTFEGLCAARQIGMTAIGILGGYNDDQRVRGANPHYVIAELPELMTILQNGRST